MTALVTAAKQLLLPAPFGPMMPRISPDRTDQLTSRSATSAPYCTVRPSTRSTSVPRRRVSSELATRPSIVVMFGASECAVVLMCDNEHGKRAAVKAADAGHTLPIGYDSKGISGGRK